VRRNIYLGWLALLPLVLSGCSVGMAMAGKDQKDTSVVFPGSPRAVVIAKLGPPETSTKNANGETVDSWLIIKGNAPSGGRAAMHAGLDVFTLGLWEVLGTPLEMGAAGEDRTRYIITYDKEDKIKDMQAIKAGDSMAMQTI